MLELKCDGSRIFYPIYVDSQPPPTRLSCCCCLQHNNSQRHYQCSMYYLSSLRDKGEFAEHKQLTQGVPREALPIIITSEDKVLFQMQNTVPADEYSVSKRNSDNPNSLGYTSLVLNPSEVLDYSEITD